MPIEQNKLIDKLTTEKNVDWEFQKRRHPQWNENYQLYRDFVETNRLEQRQAINFPIMKTSLNTLLSNVGDAPDVEYKNLGQGEEALMQEMTMNGIWDYQYDRLNFEDLDMLDKKNVFLYGRSFKMLNFYNKKFETYVIEPFDILVDPNTNPMDLQTARRITRLHIYKPLREILADDKYDQEGKEEMNNFLESSMKESGGLIAIEDEKETVLAKQERLEKLGVDNFDEFGAKDIIIELNEHYTYLWDQKKKTFTKYLITVATGIGPESKAILSKKPLKKVIGIEKWPFTTWADDVESTDFWSDGRADTVRTPNKVLNIWLSQLVENRTLRNYGMHWFDSTNSKFIPTKYEPKPFGMYPCPGDPNKLTKQVDIPDLSESLDEMQFVKQLIEEVVAAPQVKKGIEGKQKTKAEAEMLLGEADVRITGGIKKYYQKSWKQYAQLFYEIHKANIADTETITLYKESTKGSGKMFSKKVQAKDWKSKAGYRVKVTSSAEQNQKNIQEVNKWIGIKNQFPNDLMIQKMAKKKMLEAAGVKKDEIDEVSSVEAEAPLGPPAPALPMPT